MDDVIAHLGYGVVFVGTFLEGESILVLGGVAAAYGYLSFPVVVAIAILGGFLGDQLFFFVGRRYGDRVLARFPSVSAKVPRVQALLRRWDILAVILIRFLYGLRIAGPIVIGSCRIAPWRLALFNFIGALIWAPLVAGIGYVAGQALDDWVGRLRHLEILVLMVAVLGAVAWWFVIEWRRR
jgi:membrane protein DedA with SNARE-associated domain